MIITRIEGGLGNIMFQYALGRHLAYKNKTVQKFDISSCKINPLGDYSLSLEAFNINIHDYIATPQEIALLNKYSRRPGKKWFLYNKLIANDKKYITERSSSVFDPRVLEANDNVYIRGWWQNEKYFIDIRQQLLNDFTVRTPLTDANALIAQHITKSSSVAIHIRRLDFVTNSKTKKFHGELTQEYYDAALARITPHIEKPILFIFSDDTEWVKKNMTFPFETIYVEGNASKPHEDIRLMSLCNHTITANSSFSWWGAWLNQHKNKIVVAPKRWTSDPRDGTQRIAQGWIAL
jgi:hypothetical protein